ncbi:AAA family ATPase [Sinimarinibacterium thermocellulolyticum]|jgi:ATP-dependent Lon protease|uniref:AAA family ATPase n=1 Tax=Sinimarinibacterium thermocellulolyticum TaxID=3170016 RepID=A0ABV2A8Y0_9GAMM
MNDDDLVARFDALGPVPDWGDHPAGLTRLLALRVQALCRAQQFVHRRTTPSGPQACLLARDLGSVLLAYLAEAGIDIELQQTTAPGEAFTSCYGTVPLAATARLMPAAVTLFQPPMEHRLLPAALGIPASVAAWAMAAELDRVHGSSDKIRELIRQAHPLDPAWRLAYPDLAGRHPLPLAVSVVVPQPPPPPRRRRRRGVQAWTLADEALIQDRLSVLSQLKERKPATETALVRLGLRCIRTLPLATQRHANAVEYLARRFPNFEPACRWVADQIRLCAIMRVPLHLPPVLLLGPPGIGKTMFCLELAQTLGAEVCVRSLAELSASWLISGASTQWAGGRPGAIAEHLAQVEPDRVPWFVFDEIDKAAGDRGFPVGPALLGLLEPFTAQRFRDEALEIEMDIRPAGFIFTANERERVRPELISRLQVIEVRAPTRFEMPAVIASVDAQLRKERPQLGKAFASIEASVLLQLEAVAPRELRRVLLAGYAQAARRPVHSRGLRRLLATDLPNAPQCAEPSEHRVH